MIVAVLGMGSIGYRHAVNLLALEQTVVGFDPDPIQGPSSSLLLGVKMAETREAALEAADAVVIASPNTNHLEDLTAAVDAGCHVFIEKPLAHKVEGVAEVLERAGVAGLVVFVGMNLRFHPDILEARDRIAKGDLGELLWARFLSASYLPDWRPWQDYRKGYTADPVTGGVIFDSIHEFDLAHHLLGPAEVLAATARSSESIEIPSDDVADILLEHPEGIVSSLHLDYVTKTPQRTIDIMGTEGYLKIDLLDRICSANNDYRAEMASFLACIEGDWEPVCDGFEALRVLRGVIVARELAGLPFVTVRQAVRTDILDILLWRNDPRTRQMFWQGKKIDWKEHESWFLYALEDPQSQHNIFIAQIGTDKIGMVRFDTYDGNPQQFEISINMNPGWRGKGLAKSALLESIAAFRDSTKVELLRAETKETNTASRKLFLSCGFSYVHYDAGGCNYEKVLA